MRPAEQAPVAPLLLATRLPEPGTVDSRDISSARAMPARRRRPRPPGRSLHLPLPLPRVRVRRPHNDDWEANFEDLMAMEDSYGSGVEDLSSAAAELCQRAHGGTEETPGGDATPPRHPGGRPRPRPRATGRALLRACQALLRRLPSGGGGAGLGAGAGFGADATDHPRGGAGEGAAATAGATSTSRRAAARRAHRHEGDGATPMEDRPGHRLRLPSARRPRRGEAKRTPRGHGRRLPTYPKSWVEVLDIGEMWEMKTGPRNLGAFASDDDYAGASRVGGGDGHELRQRRRRLPGWTVAQSLERNRTRVSSARPTREPPPPGL